MVKKNKIIDIVFFDDEIEELKFRIEELDYFVDQFVIVDYNRNKIDIKNHLNEKIIYLKPDKDSGSSYGDIQNKLKEIFLFLKLDFEDIIIFSECNELPDLDFYDDFLINVNYSPFFLNHIVFHWDKHFYSSKKKLGSLILNFSQFIQSHTIIETYFLNKNTETFGDPDAIDCGWKFVNLFCEKNETNQLFIDEMLECCDDDPVKSIPLIKIKGDEKLPKKFNLLPNNFQKRTSVKKHLILLDSENKNYSNNYNNVRIINFSNVFPEIFLEKNDNDELLSTLFLPDQVLYGEKKYEEFIKDYKLNDIKRIIHTTFPQDQDIIHLRFKEYDFTFKWSDWKNRNLCELKNPSY